MKILSIFIVLFFTYLIPSNAQVVQNGGFENWTSLGFYEEPDSWNTTDSLALAWTGGLSHSATKEVTDIHGGAFALKLFPFSSPFGTIPGAASNGLLDIGSVSFIGGTPNTIRHQTINGWYKYAPVGNDSCTIQITLFKWIGATKTTVATGIFGTAAAASVYTPFAINLAYASGYSPDTMLISILSSSLGAAHAGTVLLIDDLSFSGIVQGLPELSGLVNSLSVFPVPASTDLTVNLDLKNRMHTSFEITDVTGKKMIVHEMNVSKTEEKINIRSLSAGNYLYILFDDRGNKLASGKFSVAR